MAVLWISFRIEEGTYAGRSYDQRYAALIEALSHHASGDAWEETTSFVLLSTNSTRLQVARSVAGAISGAHDIALVGSMEQKGLSLIGSAKEFSKLQRLVPEVDLGA